MDRITYDIATYQFLDIVEWWFDVEGILPIGGLEKLHYQKSYDLFDRKHDNWSKINFLRGVNSLIMVDKYVTSLPSFFIEGLKKFELDQGVINMCNYVTSKDDCRNFNFSISNNKLIDGLYTGIKKKNQVKLLINFFKRELFCWVSNKKIEA